MGGIVNIGNMGMYTQDSLHDTQLILTGIFLVVYKRLGQIGFPRMGSRKFNWFFAKSIQ